jgi:hypothetical protein
MRPTWKGRGVRLEGDWFYVILAVRYFDPILRKEFAQMFLQRWHPERDQLERILVQQRDEILMDQGLKYPLTDSNVI